jgi:NurA domain
MPINPQALRPQLARYAERNAARLAHRQQVLSQLRRVFDPDTDISGLHARAEFAASQTGSNRWGGARLLTEPLNQFVAFGAEPVRYALVAADGSQIMPDRHQPVLFALVQTACAVIVYGAPQVQPVADALLRERRSELLGEDELSVSETSNPAAEVSNRRDVMEIMLLAEACQRLREAGVQPIVLADGSIVPFALLNDRTLTSPALVAKLLNPVVTALDVMREAGALVCGYIDRPNAQGLVQTCALHSDDEPALDGLYDRHLFDGLLPIGHRSALFDPNWTVNGPMHLGRYGHAMRVCYANVSGGAADAAPALARLEFPAWCAGPDDIGTVCAVLARHTAMGDGYPLILKAAHEAAVVTKEDAAEVQQSLIQVLLEHGVMPRLSGKQAAKDSDRSG